MLKMLCESYVENFSYMENYRAYDIRIIAHLSKLHEKQQEFATCIMKSKFITWLKKRWLIL